MYPSNYGPPQAPIFPYGLSNQYPNPWFNVANQFAPRNLQDLVKWVRYITVQSPTVTEVLRKLSTYPITDFNIETTDERLKEQYRGVLKSLKLKEVLQNIGFQYWTLGNVFVSLYFPITRTLVCPQCKSGFPASQAPWASFKKFKFQGSCPRCNYGGAFEVKDVKSTRVEDINVILWDPQDIATEHNPITGETIYYYIIPKTIRNEIHKGNRLYVDKVPMQVIDAVRLNQDFRFDSRQFFHLKNVSAGGTIEGIAVPPLLSLFSLVFYQATLRRANEAVAMEYVAPLRVVSPATNGATDPVMATSMRKFREEIEKAYRNHKQDPNYLMVSPLPMSYQLLGGEGKTLLVNNEIAQAEEQILLSCGVSQELLSGTTNWTSSHVGLRLLENTLSHYSSRLEELIEWIMGKVSTYLEIDEATVSMTPVKLLDDDDFRQNLMALFQTNSISKQTLFEALGLDLSEEMDNIEKEAGMSAAVEVRSQVQKEVSEFLAAQKVFSEVSGTDEYKAALEKATAYSQQISNLPAQQQVMFLQQLKTTDYGQWLLVTKLLSGELTTTPGQSESQDTQQDGTQDQDQQQDDQQQAQQAQQPQAENGTNS